MKKLLLSLYLSSIFSINVNAITSSYFVAQAVEEQELIVQGKAYIEQGNLITAEKKALSEAFRNAVEKGLGVWLKSQSQVKDFELKKDEILTRADGYVTYHEVVSKSQDAGTFSVTVKVKVSVEKIGTDIKAMVARLKTQLANPTITFVLTTWENKGIKSSVEYDRKDDKSLDLTASDSVKEVVSYDDPNNSYLGVTGTDPNMSVNQKTKINTKVSIQKIDETVWKKYSDTTIVDSFKEEFLEKGFDLKAADKASEIAMSESLAQTSINISDRSIIREMAEKEGANFVARGEVQIIDLKMDENTGNYTAISKLGVEIIDVNSGQIIASYSNTASASSSSDQKAKAQVIKKIAVVGAKTLSSQTINKWQEVALNGQKYTVELRNFSSARSQKIPFLNAVKGVSEINSQTSPNKTTLSLDVTYKGKKDELGLEILEKLESAKGFSESEFEGPEDEGGKIVFRFKLKK